MLEIRKTYRSLNDRRGKKSPQMMENLIMTKKLQRKERFLLPMKR